MSEGLEWKKSTHSGDSSCVEVARLEGLTFVRNTRGPSTALVFTYEEWAAFISGVKDNEFD